MVIPRRLYQVLVSALVEELWDEITYHRLFEVVLERHTDMRSIWDIEVIQRCLRDALETPLDDRREAVLQWPWRDQWRVVDWLLCVYGNVRSHDWLRVDRRGARWVEYVPREESRANVRHENMVRTLQHAEGLRQWVERGGDEDFARRIGFVMDAGLWA